MRIWLPVVAVLLAMRAPLALADRDPNSGAPLPPPKHASTPSPITDHFYIRATYYPPQLRTSLRVDPKGAPAGVTGTPLSGENSLGLPQRIHQGRVDFMFRMRERSKVRLDYFEANRSGSRTIGNDVIFGNTTFAAGSLTQNTLNFQMGDLTYTLYLVHWPVYLALQPGPTGTHWSYWPTELVRLAIIFAIAIGSWFLIEKPLLRWRQRSAAR